MKTFNSLRTLLLAMLVGALILSGAETVSLVQHVDRLSVAVCSSSTQVDSANTAWLRKVQTIDQRYAKRHDVTIGFHDWIIERNAAIQGRANAVSRASKLPACGK